jgi:hypothetical protein
MTEVTTDQVLEFEAEQLVKRAVAAAAHLAEDVARAGRQLKRGEDPGPCTSFAQDVGMLIADLATIRAKLDAAQEIKKAK